MYIYILSKCIDSWMNPFTSFENRIKNMYHTQSTYLIYLYQKINVRFFYFILNPTMKRVV